jgi:hypothetical protein
MIYRQATSPKKTNVKPQIANSYLQRYQTASKEASKPLRNSRPSSPSKRSPSPTGKLNRSSLSPKAKKSIKTQREKDEYLDKILGQYPSGYYRGGLNAYTNLSIMREVTSIEVANQEKEIELERLRTTKQGLTSKAVISEDLRAEMAMIRKQLDDSERAQKNLRAHITDLKDANVQT